MRASILCFSREEKGYLESMLHYHGYLPRVVLDRRYFHMVRLFSCRISSAVFRGEKSATLHAMWLPLGWVGKLTDFALASTGSHILLPIS